MFNYFHLKLDATVYGRKAEVSDMKWKSFWSNSLAPQNETTLLQYFAQFNNFNQMLSDQFVWGTQRAKQNKLTILLLK